MDRFEYRSRASEFCARGQQLPQTKLLDLDVVSIRSAVRQRDQLRRHIASNLSNEAIAKNYGVHVRTIEKVISRESFSNFP